MPIITNGYNKIYTSLNFDTTLVLVQIRKAHNITWHHSVVTYVHSLVHIIVQAARKLIINKPLSNSSWFSTQGYNDASAYSEKTGVTV